MMKTKKQLGIWMDHSIAHVMEFNNAEMVITTVIAQVGEYDEALNGLDESMIQNKEQNQLSGYFKRLSEFISTYDNVLLFGPTNAKTELFNLLKSDRHFENIKIEVKPADKMTESQQHTFITNHFNNAKNGSR